jgi:UDP-glucose 4-epimerase
MGIVGVIGANGLIGRAVVQSVYQRGWQVRTYGRHNADVILDLDNPGEMAQAQFEGLGALVHCAGPPDEDFAADAAKAFRRCTVNLESLLERVLLAGVQRVAYISTAHVYGDMVGEVTESVAPAPVSNYAIGHFAAERVVARMSGARQRSCLLLRPNAVFGMPDLTSFRRWQLIPFSFPRAAVETGKIVLKTPGLQRRNFVGTPTIGEMVANFLAQPQAPRFTLLNPVGATNQSIVEFARQVAMIAETQLKRPVHVEAPVPQASDLATAPVSYQSSLFPVQPEPLSLDAFVRQFIALIAQSPQQG